MSDSFSQMATEKIAFSTAEKKAIIEECEIRKENLLNGVTDPPIRRKITDASRQLQQAILDSNLRADLDFGTGASMFDYLEKTSFDELEQFYREANSPKEGHLYLALMNAKLQEPQLHVLKKEGFDK